MIAISTLSSPSPQITPSQKSLPNAPRSGTPYELSLCFSIRAMMNPAMKAVTVEIAAAAKSERGVRVPDWVLLRSRQTGGMRKSARRNNATRAAKIRKRQPARIPFGPTKSWRIVNATIRDSIPRPSDTVREGKHGYILVARWIPMANSGKQFLSARSCVWLMWFVCLTLIGVSAPVAFAAEPIRIISFGAHPDDCDLGAGGLAAKYAARGDKVKFVSLTNGDAGHQSQHGDELAKRRRAEAQEAGRRIGIEYEVLDNPDGKLLPTLEVREQVIREIRQWKADIVIAPRPNDYHPDHRYTGVLVQDASYMVIVLSLVEDAP